MHSLASFISPSGPCGLLARPVATAFFLATLLAAGAFSTGEGRAAGRSSIQASARVVDTRVGRAALRLAAELRGCSASESSAESGLFSVRWCSGFDRIDFHHGAPALFESPRRVEIHFPAN